MKHSAPLSPAARELLELGSRVEPPTVEQCERMDRSFARLVLLERAQPPASSGRLAQRGSTDGRERPGASVPGGAALQPGWRVLRLGFGSSAGKFALALGALAATGSAAFWIGRASAPVSTRAQESVARSEMPSPPSVPSVVANGAAFAAPSQPRATAPAPLDTAGWSPSRAAEPLDLEAPEGASPLAATAPAATAPAADPFAAGRPAAIPPSSVGALAASAPSRVAPEVVGASSNASRLLPRAQPARGNGPRASTGLAAEIERLARAEAALRQGRAREALAELDQPATHLLEQAAALRAVAECELDPARGTAAARDALRRWPGSAFAPRIRSACGL